MKPMLASINSFYADIVQCLWDSSVLDVSRRKQNFYKFWWDEELNLMKEQAIQSFTAWKNIGKPRCGKEFDNMRFDKLKYKALIRSNEQPVLRYFLTV